MKIPLSWQQVGLVLVLLVGIISAHVWAPAAASAVISIASTLIGTFFVNVQRTPDPSQPPQLRAVPDPVPAAPPPAPPAPIAPPTGGMGQGPQRPIGFLPPGGKS